MAVVRNLMIRIGADYSAAQKGMQGASRELGRFKNDVTRTTSTIKGKKGLGGISGDFKSASTSVTSSLSRIRGAKGLGGVMSELKNLAPALGIATRGMVGFGGAVSGAGIAAGGAVAGVAALAAILAIASVGLYQASQAAVKFEADLGRLNLQLKGGSREFIAWARSQGLAKQSAVEMGATYSTLLSSFIKDTRSLQAQTAQFVQATRVVASNTGRSITDVTERMRSGLLGNTEAIEDLGIFVNVAMIESTDAFRKFAGDKSWNEIDFQLQQQIRLAAILEQTYKRYGDELQKNVMTKQEKMTEQLKDVKLHLSQMALPIWDSVLPAITRFSESLAFVTEKLARFFYALRGWDYDEMTSGMDDQTGASDNLGDSLDDTEKSAKKAFKALAAFDQLNLIGETGGSGTGGTGSGGSGGSGGMPPWGDPKDDPAGTPPWLSNAKRWRIEFDTPNPPDAGAGGVRVTVAATMNQMIAETKQRMKLMWDDLNAQGLVGSAQQQSIWDMMRQGIASRSVPVMTASITIAWSQMWANMLGQAQTNAPLINAQLQQLGDKVNWLKTPLAEVKASWHGTLDDMQKRLNAYRPYLEYGWSLLGKSVLSLKSPLADIKAEWNTTLSDMYSTALTKFGGIVTQIGAVINAYAQLRQAMNQPSPQPAPSPSPSQQPSPIADAANGILSGAKNSLQYTFSTDNLANMWEKIKGEAGKPQNQVAASLYGMLVPLSKLAPTLGVVGKGIAGKVDDILKSLTNAMKGGAVPAFAGGAVVSGPTLAMVGDNRNAAVDPEVIAPLSKLEAIMGGGSDNSDVVRMLERVEQAVRDIKSIQAVISSSEVTRAAIKGINDESRRTGRTPLNV